MIQLFVVVHSRTSGISAFLGRWRVPCHAALGEASLGRHCSDLVLKLKDAVGESGMQVRIGDLLNAEGVEHFVVVASRQFVEFFDSDLPVIDRDKVHEFLVLLNIHVHLLDSGGVGVDVFVDGRL